MSEETGTAKPGRRAERRAETRRRIVEATAELHTTVGPARTTISGIAARAGVQRHTVYAHFPTQDELFQACTGLWLSRNPFPHVRGWAAIRDPQERLGVALAELYDYYARTEGDLTAVFESAGRVPAMADSLARWDEAMAAAADVLARGRGARGRRRVRLLAAVGHALSLDGWRSLVRRGGLGNEEAVALMTALVDAAAPPPNRPGSVPRRR